MKKLRFKILVVITIIMIFNCSKQSDNDVIEDNISGITDIKWTFDCNNQGWGEYEHKMSFKTVQVLKSESLNSGHLELKIPDGESQGWLFAPNTPIDTQKFSYLKLSLTIEGFEQTDEKLKGLFVFSNDSNHDISSTIEFELFKGGRIYTIDLKKNPKWKGTKYLDRFHFPQTPVSSSVLNNVVFRVDWIVLTQNQNLKEVNQETDLSCKVTPPKITSDVETVVFGNRFSIKTNFTGGRSTAKLNLWLENTNDSIFRYQSMMYDGPIYMSYFDLQTNSNYKFYIEITNSEGHSRSSIYEFKTEESISENEDINFWITPSPFKLTQNANDHLLDTETWSKAAGYSQVYKVHGATDYADSKFYKYEIPKLIYTLNKYRMRLAHERVIGGDKDGSEYGKIINDLIEKYESYGGKLEFLTWDGMFYHSTHDMRSGENFRSINEGIESVAEATRIVLEKNPDFRIIPLPNLPNWSIVDNDGNVIPSNAGFYEKNIGVDSWLELFNKYLEKISQKGVSIKFIEIDHPYHYYKDKEISVPRLKFLKEFCYEKNIKMIFIINQSEVGLGSEIQDQNFKNGCLDYLKALYEDGITPNYIDLESWYPWPQYLVPETKENSFTNIARDIGDIFFSKN